MGRKKIPNSARRQVITCSLKPVTIQSMEEAIPKRANRSNWIEEAIHQKLNYGNPNEFSNKKLLAMIHGRFTNTAQGKYAPSSWGLDADINYLLEQISILYANHMED